uniref:Anaphase-promoting complex subunit 10 n=1 Tax=Steinernema glaseri TaxID=37863 RepID=A0A1I8AK19_9BILA
MPLEGWTDLQLSSLIDSMWDARDDSFPSAPFATEVRHRDLMPLVDNEIDANGSIIFASHKEKHPGRNLAWQNFLPGGMRLRDVVDVTKEANWSVSSLKELQGAGLMLSENVAEFWESEGERPHHIFCEFSTITDVIGFMVYFNHADDDSFTPRKIIAEMSQDVHYSEQDNTFEFRYSEPQGWVYNSLHKRNDFTKPTSCWAIRFVIPEMHDGRNTRIRGIKVLALSSSGQRMLRRIEDKENTPIFRRSRIRSQMTLR